MMSGHSAPGEKAKNNESIFHDTLLEGNAYNLRWRKVLDPRTPFSKVWHFVMFFDEFPRYKNHKIS